jgi:LacI family transcriptional regulator
MELRAFGMTVRDPKASRKARKSANVIADPRAVLKIATAHDVAALAGVSAGTVSRVALGSPSVAPETRGRVLAAMETLRYQPNAAAQAIRTNKTHTIGFLIPDISNKVFATVMLGVESILGPAGYMLMAVSSNRSPERECTFLDAVRQRRMDGLIVSLSDETAAAPIERLNQLGIPAVVLDRDIAVDADSVFSEHLRPMETVVEHLLDHGHRRIGLIAASDRIRPGRERVRAYRAAHAKAGLAVDEALIRSRIQSEAYGRQEAHDLLSGANPPTALIAAGSDIFPGALRAIRSLGLAIPADISFIGADDQQLAELASPQITTIDRDMGEVGRAAARLLLDRLTGFTGPPRRLLLPSMVLLGRSVAASKNS